MLFILIGLGLLLIIAILITLFSMDVQLGLIGIMTLVVILILLGKKVMKIQNLSKHKEEEDFKHNLRMAFGDNEGRRIEDIILAKSENKSHRDQNLLYINEMFKISDKNGRESVLKLLEKMG